MRPRIRAGFPYPTYSECKDAGPAMSKWLNSKLPQEQVDQAYEPLYRLFHVIRTEHLVAYYKVDSQDLHTVLQIFIRMNSGGTVLSVLRPAPLRRRRPVERP